MERYDYVLARREVIAVVIAALLCLLAGPRGEAASSGGTTIVNSVTATYSDARGRSYSTLSNVLVATVAQIGAISVSPKQTQPNPQNDTVAVNQPAARVFVVANGSNISDAYRVTALTAGTLKITAASWVLSDGSKQDAMNGAISPTIAAGGFIKLVVTVSTTGLTVGTQVPVDVTVQTTAGGTVNGLQSDTGREWIVGASAPVLTGPSGANTQVTKTANKVTVVQSEPGSTVTFDIAASNSGGSAAQNVVVTDNVPGGMTIVASSAKIDGQAAGPAATVQGQTITVNVGTLAAGASLDVSFQATVPPGQVLGESFVNIASIAADGIPAQQTTPASVLAGTANIVFDGFGGEHHPIGGAVVALLDAQHNPVQLESASSDSRHTAATVPGAATQNPFVTGADGAYGFALQPDQIAPGGSRFFLTIAAPGYLNRQVQLDITPGAENELYDVKATSLDGQPLATAGGFTLTGSAVQLQNVFGLFGNLPLFSSKAIDVTKTSDRQAAAGGDRVVYTVGFTNTSASLLAAASVVDTLPPGMVYATGTGRMDGVAVEPLVEGRTLTWTLPQLAAGVAHTLTYATVVFPSVTEGTILTNTATVTGELPSTTAKVSGSASASIAVIAGALTDRRVVTGRVFVDSAGSGHFARGDSGVAGVRVYLEDGSYAVTDAGGRFSFPSVRPGMHVLRLDATTLPAGLRAFPAAPMNSTRATQRLLHGILDGGTMEDVEFALQGPAK